VADCNRLAAGEPGLNQATLVAAPGFFAVLIAQVHFDARDVFTEVAEGMIHPGLNPMHQPLMALNVVIRIDLNLHVFSLWGARLEEGGRSKRGKRPELRARCGVDRFGAINTPCCGGCAPDRPGRCIDYRHPCTTYRTL
jgi:hypothetical protein